MVELAVPAGVNQEDPAYIENPATGERMLFHSPPDAPRLDSLIFDIWASPGMEPLKEHVHPNQDETLTVNAGAVNVSRRGGEEMFSKGDRVLIQAGTPHTWWVGGEEELHLTVEVEPGLNTEDFFRDLATLAQRGRVKSNGAPSLLQIAALFDNYGYGVLHLGSPPLPVQKVVFGALAPVARVLGYRANPVAGRNV